MQTSKQPVAEKPADSIAVTLTEEERLRLENYNLKSNMLGMEVAMKRAALAKELEAIVATIKSRTGVDIRDEQYEVDIEHGVCSVKPAKQ